MAVITRNDDSGKCIAFEFDIAKVTFACRLLDRETNKWVAIPVSLNETGAQLQSVVFDVMGSQPTLERIERTAKYNINKAYEDIIVAYVDITEEIRKGMGVGSDGK